MAVGAYGNPLRPRVLHHSTRAAAGDREQGVRRTAAPVRSPGRRPRGSSSSEEADWLNPEAFPPVTCVAVTGRVKTQSFRCQSATRQRKERGAGKPILAPSFGLEPKWYEMVFCVLLWEQVCLQNEEDL